MYRVPSEFLVRLVSSTLGNLWTLKIFFYKFLLGSINKMKKLTEEQKEKGRALLKRMVERSKQAKQDKEKNMIRPEVIYDDIFFEGLEWLDKHG